MSRRERNLASGSFTSEIPHCAAMQTSERLDLRQIGNTRHVCTTQVFRVFSVYLCCQVCVCSCPREYPYTMGIIKVNDTPLTISIRNILVFQIIQRIPLRFVGYKIIPFSTTLGIDTYIPVLMLVFPKSSISYEFLASYNLSKRSIFSHQRLLFKNKNSQA